MLSKAQGKSRPNPDILPQIQQQISCSYRSHPPLRGGCYRSTSNLMSLTEPFLELDKETSLEYSDTNSNSFSNSSPSSLSMYYCFPLSSLNLRSPKTVRFVIPGGANFMNPLDPVPIVPRFPTAASR